LLLPFQSLFPNPSSGRFTFELTTLAAIILYPIFAWIILKGVYLSTRCAWASQSPSGQL